MGRDLTYSKNIKYWIIPISVVISIWILSYLRYYYYEKSENDKLQLETQITGEQVKLRLESWINHRIEIVENMALHRTNNELVNDTDFQSKATELLSWIPGLQALNWIDKHWIIQTVVPAQGNEPALGKDLHFHPSASVQEALLKAQHSKKISRTKIVKLLQGGEGFATYWPVVNQKNDIIGYINGVLKVDKLIESCFSEPMLTERFSIKFYEDDKLIYPINENGDNDNPEIVTILPVQFVDADLKMKIMPTEKYISATKSFISNWMLLVTFLFSIGLGVLLRISMLHNRLMRKSEERFRTVVENAGEAFFLVDKNRNIIDVNQQACKELQYTKKELISMTLPDIDKIYDFGSCQPLQGETQTFETVHTRKDKTTFPVEIRSSLLELHDTEYTLCLSRNITESKKLQELENRSQRLETAGQVAGQVAHDFNNLLDPLIAYPEFIKELLEDDHPALELVTKIENSANQIAEINQQLLTLGRRGHYNIQVIDMNEMVQNIINEIKIQNTEYHFQTELEEKLLPIKGGYSQILRIITNLIHNAIDASELGGVITIKTQNYYLDESEPAYFNIPLGEYVKVTVSDDGHGIPEDVLPTIFDPFVSTKSANKKRGSGLGLSIVDSVVKDHNGYIDVQTEVGKGTEFYLYFPVTREEESDTENSEIVGGHEKILVVDDDEMILEVTQKILKILGYDVTTATNGDEALEYIKKKSYDLLILDMIIPYSIDGTEIYKQSLKYNKNQKAIIVSGYAESDRVKEAISLGVSKFIKKPFTKECISKAIRNTLHQEEASIIESAV